VLRPLFARTAAAIVPSAGRGQRPDPLEHRLEQPSGPVVLALGRWATSTEVSSEVLRVVASVVASVVSGVVATSGGNAFEATLLEAHGFERVGMGARTLRTGTACVAPVAFVHDALVREGARGIVRCATAE
jgi:hypothetical protein